MLSDLRFALRSLAKTPGFTTAAVLILALGIGVNTAVFSVVEAVLLRPLPYRQPSSLFLFKSAVENQFGLFNFAEFAAYRDQTKTFSGMSAVASYNTTLIDHDEAQLVQGLRLSANIFNILGVQPTAGRLLTPDDDRPDSPKVTVISYALWQRVFGGRADAIGRTVELNGEARTIVGVLPREILLPVNAFNADVCVPLQPDADPARNQTASLHFLRVVARLAPGVTPAQAIGDSQSILNRLRHDFPADFIGQPQNQLTPLATEIVGDSRAVLLTLLGIVGSLLLLASANLAGLLLVRAIGRQREFAIRSALGASRRHLMRLLLTESAVLAVIGAVIGLLLAEWSEAGLLSLIPSGVPRAHDVSVNATVVLFTIAVSLVAGLAPGLVPLWLCSRLDLREVVNTGGRGNTASPGQMKLRHILASIQVALALALLACTGLFLRSFWAVGADRPGSDLTHTLTARFSAPKTAYPDPRSLIRYYDRLQPRLAAIPTVTHVGSTSLLPLATGLATTEFTVTGRPVPPNSNPPSANYRLVSAEYFSALGIALQQGRFLTDTDDPQHPLAVLVSAALANAFFPGQSPLGQRLQINDSAAGYRTFQIVGVVADVKQSKMEDAPSYDVYVSFRQMDAVAVPWLRLRTFWVVRTTGPIGPVETALRRIVREVDPGVAISAVATMDQVVESAMAVRRFTLIIVGFLAGAALLLTITGVYATIAYGVAQRTREMGVRLALGASGGQIFGLVLRDSMILVGVGAALGIMAALGLSRLLASQLYGVSPHDPAALAASALLLLVIAAIASSLPATRAARVDPLVAMRAE